LGVPSGIQARFDAEVARLHREITQHKEAVALTPDRRLRIDTLTSLLKRLDALISVLRENERVLHPLMRTTAMPRLGALLSASGIESLMGSVGWDIDDRAIDDVLKRRGRGDATFMDGLTQSRRQRCASEMGPELLVRLLQTQRGPVAHAIALEKRFSGGRPEHRYRNYVVLEFAKGWANETGQRPPSGKTGPFYDLCEQALIELGLSRKGLEDSVYRIIGKLFPPGSPQNPS
jgi:hypothetical protein